MAKEIKKSLVYFFAVAFGGMVFVAVLRQIYFAMHDSSSSPAWFNYVLMLMPAAGVMAGKMSMNKKETVGRKFYIFYLTVTIISIAAAMVECFFPIDLFQIAEWGLILASFAGYSFFVDMSEEERLQAGISIKVNYKKAVFGIGLFILLYILKQRLAFVMNFLESGDIQQLLVPIADWGMLFRKVPISLLLGYIVILGEEYGWRYFLQPILTEKYGKRKGILFVGIIWSVWHLEFDVVYNQLPMWAIPYRFVNCISLSFFLGWIYEKTRNTWAVVMIHWISNIFTGMWNSSSESKVWWEILLLAVVFLPFAFSKTLSESPKESNCILENEENK